MKQSIIYKKLFAYSPEKETYFHTNFSPNFNIVYGKNTSGKSTLIESILYTFGINDEKHKLSEVLTEGVIFRLDFEIKCPTNGTRNFIAIREDDILVIRESNGKTKKFIGISGNSSFEHRELKKFLANLFKFNLFLEYSEGYKQAPIEALFLPFYVAQDVGWVYRHKSFRGLDFIKNFKTDFFDYYLGIAKNNDRNKKISLEIQVRDLNSQLEFFQKIQRNNIDLNISNLLDEKNLEHSLEYLEKYKLKISELIKIEQEYLLESNSLAFLENRKKFLMRVRRQLIKQDPNSGTCPTCNQKLPDTAEVVYRHYQDLNDTENQIGKIKSLVKEMSDIKGKTNQLKNKVINLRNELSTLYQIYENYNNHTVTFENWLKVKVNIKLSKDLIEKTAVLQRDIQNTKKEIAEFEDDESIKITRNARENIFSNYFKNNLKTLGVKPFDDNRYTKIYTIPAFPKQGVELLKTLLAYNFAFCKIIQETGYVNNFPLLLDAIFKEDIDEDNRVEILKFIKLNTQGQIIFSIADSINNKVSANHYNDNYFHGDAKMICIGSNQKQRAFLSPYTGEYNHLLDETLYILNAT